MKDKNLLDDAMAAGVFGSNVLDLNKLKAEGMEGIHIAEGCDGIFDLDDPDCKLRVFVDSEPTIRTRAQLKEGMEHTKPGQPFEIISGEEEMIDDIMEEYNRTGVWECKWKEGEDK